MLAHPHRQGAQRTGWREHRRHWYADFTEGDKVGAAADQFLARPTPVGCHFRTPTVALLSAGGAGKRS